MTDVILVTNEKDLEITKLKKSITKEDNLIITGLDASAAKNRNYGLSQSKYNIQIMIDDDIEGFYWDWIGDLIKPMLFDKNIIILAARLLDKDGTFGSMMNCGEMEDEGLCFPQKSAYKDYCRVPTACIAVRNNPVRFDENFIGSGYEDTAYMNEINKNYPELKVMVNNDCKLIHRNEKKNQGGKYFEHNKKHYLSLYDDPTVRRQTDWTCTK